MKINLTKEQILVLVLEHKINIHDIDDKDRSQFINQYAMTLLNEAFKKADFKNLESLFDIEEVKNKFMNEIKTFNNLANISYLDKLPKNNIIADFILSMSRQNHEEKKDFFQKIVPLLFEYKEDMTKFFQIRIGENTSSFPQGQPIGLFFLRVLDKDIQNLLDQNIISMKLFSPKTKDTIGHYMYQYTFENNKTILERFENLSNSLKDKNHLNETPIDKLISDLRERNIQTLEYLFSEKLEISLYKAEFLKYVIKASNIFKNKQTKPALKEKLFNTLEVLFNLPQLQSNEKFKEEVAKNLANKCPVEIQYLWLNAKLPAKGLEIKKPKI